MYKASTNNFWQTSKTCQELKQCVHVKCFTAFSLKYFHSWRLLERLVEWLLFLMVETWWISKLCLALLSQALLAYCCCCSASSPSPVPNLMRAEWIRKLVWQGRYCQNLWLSFSLEIRVCASYKAVWYLWGRGDPVLQWREVFCTSSCGGWDCSVTDPGAIQVFKFLLQELLVGAGLPALRFTVEICLREWLLLFPVPSAPFSPTELPLLGSQPSAGTAALGYVSPGMAHLKCSDSLFDHSVPQTILLPLQEELSCFPSVDFGSSHCEAIQAVKSFLIPLLRGRSG